MFKRFNASGIRYAVMRNYDEFPHFRHDVDVAIDSKDVPCCRQILAETARNLKWDSITECTHWCRVSNRPQNIEIYRFYHLNPLAYLQVDLFHGFVLWGVPLFNESQLLHGRVYDPRGFYRIDPAIENTIRLFQIQSLLAVRPPPWDKIHRYEAMILDYDAQNSVHFRDALSHRLGSSSVDCVDALVDKKYSEFRKTVFKIRGYLVYKAFCRKPFNIIRGTIGRFGDQLRSWYSDPCGLVITVFGDPSRRTLLSDCLHGLEQANVVHQWFIRENGGAHWTSWRERTVLERGGLVVRWTKDCQNPGIDLNTISDHRMITELIMGLLVSRHARL